SVEYIPPDVGTELLVVAEQALSNVAVHADASEVIVTIAADTFGAWLRVVDDGRGIGAEPRGKGMDDMAERALFLGGTCTWRPSEPSGTIVDWRVPLRPQRAASLLCEPSHDAVLNKPTPHHRPPRPRDGSAG